MPNTNTNTKYYAEDYSLNLHTLSRIAENDSKETNISFSCFAIVTLVTRYDTFQLMSLISDLTYVTVVCRNTTRGTQVQIKGERFILSTLQGQYPFVETLSADDNKLNSVKDSMKEWIAILDNKYSENLVILGAPFYIQEGDAKKLVKDSERWINTIYASYNKDETAFINRDKMNDIISSMTMGLDEIAKKDLQDGKNAILHNLPTPASMILFRVAENIVRKYYTQITGNQIGRKNWGNILDELLAHKKKENESLMGYLLYLKNKRNEADHPDKRFTQEESERILLNIKNLYEEVQPKK